MFNIFSIFPYFNSSIFPLAFAAVPVPFGTVPPPPRSSIFQSFNVSIFQFFQNHPTYATPIAHSFSLLYLPVPNTLRVPIWRVM